MSKKALLITIGILATINLGLLGALITIKINNSLKQEGNQGMGEVGQTSRISETLNQDQITPPFSTPPPFSISTSTPNQALQSTTTQTTITQENQIDTSDWKTYRNEEFGFSLKYPADWDMVNPNYFGIGIGQTEPYSYISSVAFSPDGTYLITVGIVQNQNRLSPTTWFDRRQIEGVGSPLLSQKDFILDSNFLCIEIITSGGKSIENSVVCGKDSLIFEIIGGGYGTGYINSFNQYEPYFDRVISSFRFLR